MDRGYVGPDSEPLPGVREPRRTEEPEGAVVAPSVPAKRCTKCGLVKEATTENFHRYKKGEYGFRAACLLCCNAQHGKLRAQYKDGSRSRVVRATKKCSRCKRVLAVNKDNFHVIPSRPDGCHNYCRSCHSDAAVQYNYGIAPNDYQALLAAQAGACAICKKPQSGTRSKRLVVDHDHATGVVRGLLCTKCNVALGHLESIDLEAIQAYQASPPAVAVLGVKKVPLK